MVSIEWMPFAVHVIALIIVPIVPMIMGVVHMLCVPIVIVECDTERRRIGGVPLAYMPAVSVAITSDIRDCGSGRERNGSGNGSNNEIPAKAA